MVDVPEASAQLIVIGASAGGVEALSTLVSTLPDRFPVPIVIAQHLDPKRPSHLAEILGRRSRLPVETVTEHEPLLPGVVYVVPSNRHVQISDHAITLRTDAGDGPKPSVDLLFTSAARIYGENLIAVILTGTGSDGTVGAREVKKAGGTVVIQDPLTAAFPGMPGSLAPNTVDIVADLERIGPLLQELLTGSYVPSRVQEDQGLQQLLDNVREKSGIDFNSYKAGTIQRRLQRRIVAVGAANLAQYADYLKTHPGEYQRLVSSFLIKVTEFMRDPELFAYLREQILPKLITKAQERGNDLRLWSAGCATGEEAYSLAILVCEALGDALEQFNVRIFATDLDPEAIAFARQGTYPASVVEDLPRDLLDRYFNEMKGSYQIKKQVRSLTVFGEHDQGQRAPFPRIDLVLSRNVLIYFTSELQRRTLQLFAFSLNDQGFLVLGKAETTSPLSEYFTPYHSEFKIYQRHGERGVILAPRLTAPSFYLKRPTPLKARPIPRADLPATELDRVGSATHNLLLNLPLGVVLVNARYDILEINSAARRLLSIHHPAIGEDFVHLAQNLSHRELRAAIDATLRGDSPRFLEASIETAELEKPSHLRLSFHSHKAEMRAGPVQSVLILVDDITQIAEIRRRLEDGNANQVRLTEELTRALEELKAANVGLQERNRQLEAANNELAGVRGQAEDAKDHAEHRMERIAEVNRELVAANEQLTQANEQLRSANQEFLLTTEETQATTEEVETLNEELQASNEEFETLNEELQATIEELNTTNSDLEARTLELRDLAATADRERRGLSAILASIGEAVLVVDRAGKHVQTNASFESMFAGEFAPQDENGRPLAQEETPQARAALGQSFRMEFTVSSADGMGRRYFEASGRPIQHHEGGELESGVIVIRDITGRSLQRLQDRFLAMASHELRTPLVPLQGYLDMLLRLLPEKGGDERLRQYATIAHSQVSRLTGLIGDLVDTACLKSGKFTLKLAPLDLVPLVEQSVEMGKTMAQGQEILKDLEAGRVVVAGDAHRLEQVVMNLLQNAINHAPGTERIEVSLKRKDGEAELRVVDHGPGIPEEDWLQLFTIFYQAERSDGPPLGGLGLGLYIAREIVSAHGGRISVDSTVGKGSAFKVRLPLLKETS